MAIIIKACAESLPAESFNNEKQRVLKRIKNHCAKGNLQTYEKTYKAKNEEIKCAERAGKEKELGKKAYKSNDL